MNRKELIAAVAQKTKLSQALVTDVLQTFTATVSQQLQQGKKVTFTGFGTFLVSKRGARSGVLPQDKTKRIKIPALKTPIFRAGKPFKNALRP